MLNKNKSSVQLTGYVGKDVILTHCSNGNKKAIILLATNVFRTGADNILIKETMWYKIIAWGRMAEDISVYAKKGSKLKVTGHAHFRSNIGQNESSKKISEIILTDYIKLPNASQKEHI